MFEDENLKLSKDLSDVFRENERINEEYFALYDETKLKEKSLWVEIKQKDAEINQLTNKINELEINIERYEANLINIRKNYDNTVYEYQQEISRKNEDFKFMIEEHAKEIKEV
jgi:succinylglutamate desuccinylase